MWIKDVNDKIDEHGLFFDQKKFRTKCGWKTDIKNTCTTKEDHRKQY